MKAINWAILNGLFLLVVYLGFVEGMIGARNVAVFLAWFAFVMAVLAVLLADKSGAFKHGPSVPTWVSLTTDLAALVVFLWYGWFVTAAAWLIHTGLTYGGFKYERDKAEKGAA